ncbi:ribosomal RNA small subunit methyltransferase (EMG1) [Vairimorpha necatrix]|uniref:Ribosomal RNA small subunit methyltransferase (EMG1) n=1 Tax=Vairimorpha necatrix TaxID=6039 RepID=A0AAX4JD36_9MICR
MDNYKPLNIIFSNTNISDLSKLHISLLVLQQSTLNITNKLKIFIKTQKNVLIQIHHQLEIPLSLNDFTSMMTYLLEKMKIKDDKGTVLMSVIKNRIGEYLPPNTYKMRLDVAGKMVSKDEGKTYAIFINENDGEEDMETVRVSDYKMDSIGISNQITNIFSDL